ncbi:MAG: 30S ribosomal protein S7 [Spirochaetaceae bacterium]|nr:30S ribosomal protein S7 [Spirochaetaceae bacterium]MCF7947920.1 30S ribosomal protein S7 [Spirochaetia bacterium]MCF7950666.1 30S ribosomal protein S7 [Spirochaetaceae bacterium]
MGRKKFIREKVVLPDSRYGSTIVTKFITRMMLDGKKATSQRVMYEALEQVAEKSGKDGLEVFQKALENVKPSVEVKSRRVGGSTYQVPVEVREKRRDALAMRWIIQAARSRSGKSMGEKLFNELYDAYNSTGTAFRKKEDTHRMAEANKAFSHYRW